MALLLRDRLNHKLSYYASFQFKEVDSNQSVINPCDGTFLARMKFPPKKDLKKKIGLISSVLIMNFLVKFRMVAE